MLDDSEEEEVRMRPPWDLKTPLMVHLMELWLNQELDWEKNNSGLRLGPVEGRRARARALIAALEAGRASPGVQRDAAGLLKDLLTPQPMRRGRPPRDPALRDALLFLTAQDARRMKELMQEDWGRFDEELAAKWAVRRNWALAKDWAKRHKLPFTGEPSADEDAADKLKEAVIETLRRPTNRNFGSRQHGWVLLCPRRPALEFPGPRRRK